jgi:uncharacterized protein YjfI (DUF2170 family)
MTDAVTSNIRILLSSGQAASLILTLKSNLEKNSYLEVILRKTKSIDLQNGCLNQLKQREYYGYGIGSF